MRLALCWLAILLLIYATSCNAFINHRHVGALNRRLQLTGSLSSVGAAPEQWFTQTIDHFDGTNLATFQQRFFVNDSVWDPSQGPVFLVLGGEGPVSPAYVGGAFNVNNLAVEHRALIVALEHRFYGSSVPKNDSSVSNLRFLSSQQALADVATFHAYLSSLYKVPSTSKWVSFGGSYSGSLSAWLRLKYPHLIEAAFAASAPVKAALDFPQYFQVVARSLGDSCSQKVKRGYDAVQKLLQDDAGKAKLVSVFNLCTPLTSDDDIAQFLSTLSNPFCEVVQYNDDNRAGSALNIPALCEKLESVDDDLEAMAVINTFFSGPSCMEVSYKQYVQDMQSTSAGRSWTFQTCTEFGYYQTAETQDQPFPSQISLNFFLKQCDDIFGIKQFRPHIDFTNQYYGSRELTSSNVFVTNGSVDPWHVLGITQYEAGLEENTAVIFMNGTAHCADLYAPGAGDLAILTAAREIQKQYLYRWLK